MTEQIAADLLASAQSIYDTCALELREAEFQVSLAQAALTAAKENFLFADDRLTVAEQNFIDSESK